MNTSRTRLATLCIAAVAVPLTLTACGSSKKTATPAETSPSSDSSSTAPASTAASGAASSFTCASGTIAGQGSTFQQNIELQWISDLKDKCSGLNVDYQGTGSGAGIQAFNANQVDYAGSDSLMKDDEQAAADKRCGSPAIHIPITAGGIVLVYNLPGVKDLSLSAKSLAGIFQGTITTWDDASIKADNPGVTLPSTKIAPVHRSDSSGTTDVFSKFLNAEDPTDWKLGTGKDIVFPTSIQAAKGSDGVSGLVKSTEGGIAYTELSFAVANDLTTAKVIGAGGTGVEATGENVAAALATATSDTSKGDIRVTLDFGTKTGYPISAVSYVIVCSKGNKNLAPLKSFLDYAVGDGQTKAADIGYAPMPSEVQTAVKSLIDSIS